MIKSFKNYFLFNHVNFQKLTSSLSLDSSERQYIKTVIKDEVIFVLGWEMFSSRAPWSLRNKLDVKNFTGKI